MARFLAIVALGLISLAAHAQNQVANYGFGKPSTATYEHFSFWAKDGHRTDIAYAYGHDRKDSQLRYLGPVRVKGQAGFKVQSSNGRTLYLVPSGSRLLITAAGTAPKIFAWEYEGPVNGIGTFCSVCAQDEQAAMRLLQRCYLR